MSIKKQFGEYGLMTEKQKNKLKKRVFNEYYENKRRYNAQDIEDLFNGTNFPQEIISKELSTIVKNDRYFPKPNSKNNQKLSKIKIVKENSKPLSTLKKIGLAALLGGAIAGGAMALSLASCSPAKLEYLGNINGEQVKYLEKLILDGDTGSYDTWSYYEIDVTKKDETKIKYICNSDHGELILGHMQIINSESSKDYYKDEILSIDMIKKGQTEVDNYIKEIRELKRN